MQLIIQKSPVTKMRNRGFFYFLLIRTNCGLFLLASLAINNDAERINASASTKSPPVVLRGKRIVSAKNITQFTVGARLAPIFLSLRKAATFYNFSLEAFLFLRNLKMQL